MNLVGESYQVDMLLTCLLNFPQINMVVYHPQGRKLEFRFLVQGIRKGDFRKFKEIIRKYWHSYLRITKKEASWHCQYRHQNGLGTIYLFRDLDSFAFGELKIVVHLLMEQFGSALLWERDEVGEPNWIRLADLDDLITLARGEDNQRTLKGIRLEDRVLVYQHDQEVNNG